MPDIFSLYTATEAFDELLYRRKKYYGKYWSMFSGDHQELSRTGDPGTFWKRRGKVKLHVPIAADIASISSNLLFGNEPHYSIFDESLGDTELGSQPRLDQIVSKTGLNMKLREAAESASASGDVYLKCRFDKENANCPTIDIVAGQDALAEYRLNQLVCVHFFSVIKYDRKSGRYWRVYEQYTPGMIRTMIYCGYSSNLGEAYPENMPDIGLEEETVLSTKRMLAAHITNLKPSRIWQTSDKGRADCEGIRDMLDSLDETYTSWMRDIRLAKSRLIVPAEFLRKRPAALDGDNSSYTFDFDEDVETLVALDIVNDKEMKITPSQFQIRSEEHYKAYDTTLRSIISMAGYSPQSFGLDVKGDAESGTAKKIQERKSIKTTGKKQGYWKTPLEEFLTAVLHLDQELYGNPQLHDDDSVLVELAEPMTTDPADLASAVSLLHSAQAASTETLIRMLHPEWTDSKVKEEQEKIYAEYGIAMPNIDLSQGDGENQ